MPKLKTKSAVKKRFKLTATGKVIASQAGKKHFLRRRTKAQIRNLRGTTILCLQDGRNIVTFYIIGFGEVYFNEIKLLLTMAKELFI